MNARAAQVPLACRGLTVRYGARTALHELTLSLRAGEFVALAGPNGSGKTTLLRAVLDLLPVSAGTIELFGEPSDSLTVLARALRVAWVPQEESPRDNIRLIDYVRLGRYPFHGLLDAESADDREVAARVLAEVGLSDRAEDGILNLSGGERQRAVLARALAQEAPLLLLDEPTTHLDIGHQLDLLTRVRALSRDRGVTVLAAIHDLNLAVRFADRIVVLSRGRLYADGTPRDVLSAGLLEHVWGISADLRPDPRTGLPYLVPQRRLAAPADRAGPRPVGTIHVVGGGGSAAPYLRALAEEGYLVSAGVLPLLDSDSETAEALAIPVAAEVPFAPLSAAARERNRAFLTTASAVVVAPFPVGPSNLDNLADLEPFAGRIPVYLAGPPAIADRDFTGGEATAVYGRLRAAGAVEVKGVDGALRALAHLPVTALAGPTGAGAAQR